MLFYAIAAASGVAALIALAGAVRVAPRPAPIPLRPISRRRGRR